MASFQSRYKAICGQLWGGEAERPLPDVLEYKQTKEGAIAFPYESGHEHRFFHRLAEVATILEAGLH